MPLLAIPKICAVAIDCKKKPAFYCFRLQGMCYSELETRNCTISIDRIFGNDGPRLLPRPCWRRMWCRDAEYGRIVAELCLFPFAKRSARFWGYCFDFGNVAKLWQNCGRAIIIIFIFYLHLLYFLLQLLYLHHLQLHQLRSFTVLICYVHLHLVYQSVMSFTVLNMRKGHPFRQPSLVAEQLVSRPVPRNES